jgi:hypothetical protein
MSGNWGALEEAVRERIDLAYRQVGLVSNPRHSVADRRRLLESARLIGFTFQQIADLTEYANKGTIYDILNGRFDR